MITCYFANNTLPLTAQGAFVNDLCSSLVVNALCNFFGGGIGSLIWPHVLYGANQCIRYNSLVELQ